MDDLDRNPLYRDFLTRFKSEFDLACKMSHLIAIPHSDCLVNIIIDRVLANSHILMPSKLLKMHYTPLQRGHLEDIELDGGKLHVRSNRKDVESFVVNIIAESIGYNIYNKEHRIILIDKPLIAASSRLLRKRTSSSFSYFRRKLFNAMPTKPLKNHDDCFKYLEHISPELTAQLSADLKRLHSNYLILSHYLNDAAEKIKDLSNKYIIKYEEVLDGENVTICASIGEALTLATETFALHVLHDKLMATIQRRFEKEDNTLARNYRVIEDSNLTICQLGAQSAFDDFALTGEVLTKLCNLRTLQSALAIVTSLVEILDLVSESLNQSVKVKRMIGGADGLDTMCICSDDLIASLVYSIVRAKPANLYSLSKYLEIFGWSSKAKDQAAYYTATFQIVVQYIVEYNTRATGEIRENSTKPSGCRTEPTSMKLPLVNYRLNADFVDSLESRNSPTNESSLSSLSDINRSEWEVI